MTDKEFVLDERFKHLLDTLIVNLPLSPEGYYCNSNDLPSYISAEDLESFDIEDLIHLVYRAISAMKEEFEGLHYYIYTGASKLCIYIKEFPYVIKIPFNGEVCTDYDCDEECDYLSGFEHFSGADCDEFSWDYCSAESELYDTIPEEFRPFFYKTVRYGSTFCNYPIYLQEKAVMLDSFDLNSLSKDSMIKGKAFYEEFYIASSKWTSFGVEAYGAEKMYRFLEYLENNFDDIHNGNVGLSETGKPVVFDYSGFDS